MRAMFRLLVISALLGTFGCATTPVRVERAPLPDDNSRVAAINRALEGEKNGAHVSALLFERGHIHLELAEQLRDRGANAEEEKTRLAFSTYILYALQDFEAIVGEFPAGAEAPEALYHLGVIYDYPNISSFGPALRYYRRTVDEYPGSDAAARARVAVKKIEDNVKQVMDGEHGEEM